MVCHSQQLNSFSDVSSAALAQELLPMELRWRNKGMSSFKSLSPLSHKMRNQPFLLQIALPLPPLQEAC